MEVVVVIAVESVGVRRAQIRHRHPRTIDVAHDVVFVPTVPVWRRVWRGLLHAAECVHQLVGLDDAAPAAGVDTGEHRGVAIVGVGLAEPVV